MSEKLGFSLASLATYEWPVDVKVPVNGDFETHRFTGVFKHLAHDEAKAMLERLNQKAEGAKAEDETNLVDTATQIAENQIELYSDIFKGWGNDLTDENGQAIPVTDDAKRALLSQRIIRDAVIKAHRDSQAGEAVRAKNFETSPEAGQQTGES